MEHLATQVLIVGAGPTGLMAANQLQRFGVDFIIVDSKSGPTIESRAIAVTARSLEIYQQMGVSDHVLNNGKPVTSLNIYSGGKPRAVVPIGEIGKGLTDFSYLFAFEQSRNEELLVRTLEETGGKVLWNHEFVEILEYENGVRATVRCNGQRIQIKALYLIGCDGARSPVRHQLNFTFKGGTYKHKFFVADTRMDWQLDYDQLIVSPGDENFCAFIPLYGEKNYRVIGTLPARFADQEDVTFREIESVVLKTIGLEIKFKAVNWFSVYKLHHRGVQHFREGNVFLAGDSAHIHSPAGGQGMNTGLQDAYNLCWKLAMVLKYEAPDGLLDTYNEERLPFAKWLLGFTDRGFNMMTSDNWFIRLLRKFVILNLAGWVVSNRRVRRRAFRTVSQIDYDHRGKRLSQSGGPRLRFKAGDRVPYFHNQSIYPLLRNPGFHLIHVARDSWTQEDQQNVLDAFPFPVWWISQDLDDKWSKQGIRKEAFILVRPDNYVAWITDSMDVSQMKAYLDKAGFRE